MHEQWYANQVLSIVGTSLQIDQATINRTRPHLSKDRIEVDLRRPLPTSVCVGTLDDKGNPVGGYDQAVEYEEIPEYCLQCKHQGHSIYDCVYNEKNKGKGKEKNSRIAKDHEGHNQNQKAKPVAKNNTGEEGGNRKQNINQKAIKQVYKVTKDNNIVVPKVATVGTNDAIGICDSTSASTNDINNATMKVSNTTKDNDNVVAPKDDMATSRDAQMNVSDTPIVNSGKNTTNSGRSSSASPNISTKDITKQEKGNMMEGPLATSKCQKESSLSRKNPDLRKFLQEEVYVGE